MRSAVVLTVLVMSGAGATAQSRPQPPAAGATEAEDVVLEGELETHIAVGRETTGWRLRRRNAQGRREYIEVLLTAEVAQGVRANTRVRIRGAMKTRHFPGRGDVPVLMATEVIEVARVR